VYCCGGCFFAQVIGSQIERQQDDNACLAYWLTNTVTLLHLLQRNIKPASGSGSVKRAAAAAGRSIMGGLFGRQPMGGEWLALHVRRSNVLLLDRLSMLLLVQLLACLHLSC
jgi:hypothetical protein